MAKTPKQETKSQLVLKYRKCGEKTARQRARTAGGTGFSSGSYQLVWSPGCGEWDPFPFNVRNLRSDRLFISRKRVSVLQQLKGPEFWPPQELQMLNKPGDRIHLCRRLEAPAQARKLPMLSGALK